MGQSPARAERGGEAGPSGSGGKGDGKGKAPLRGTQSLSSIEKGIQKVDRPTAGLSRAARAASASLAFSLDSSLAAPSTSNAMRRPPTRMTPAVEEGENTARSPVMMPSSFVKSESLTPRRNPCRQCSLTPSCRIDLTASPSDKSASLSKVQKEMGATIEISDSESEGRRRVGLLAGASASPQKRSRGSARIRKYKMMRDELGRDVMDLTVSSPSASSSVLDDSDDSEIVVVTRPRHSSRASSATPKAGPSGTQSLRVKREPTASVSPAKSSSLASPSRRAAPLASSLKENNGAFSPRKKIAEELMPPPVSPMRKSAPSTPKKATDALPAMPRPLCSGSKSLPNVSEGEQGDWIASSSPRRTATPAVSVTSASSSSPSKRARSDGSSSRGLPDSPNLRLLRSSPRPEMCSNPSDSSRSTITASQPLTPRRGSASAFNSLAQANTDANAEAGPSNLTSPALRRLTDFDKRDTRRAPGGGPSYVREPTGSPLSSLAPTPKKPLSRAATWTSGSTAKPRPSREHNFELIIETKPVPGSRTASLKKFTPVATGKGKGKAAAAPNFKKNEVRKARDGLTSEWDAFMQDASSDEGSDDESDDREGSPSPAKSRKPPRRSRNDASDSDSGSSSSSSDESAAESDDDELADFLNRAKARREAGETLASTIDTSPSAATAPSTVSPDRVIDDPRRSSRAKRETNHYSPSKAAKPPASSLATSTAKAKKATESLGLMDQTTKRSVLQFDRIMKDRAAREKKGHTDEWYAKWKTELGRNDGPESDDDFDTGSDTSMTSDLEASSALGRVKPLDTSVVTSALATDSDEDLPAPGALAGATQKKAALIENLLSEETEQEKKEREAAVESKQQLDLRTFWRPSEMCSIDELDREEYVGDGWRGQIAQALRDIFAPPMRFPSAVTLFSPLSSGGIGSQEDHQVVSRWLVQLLCFPGETFAGEHLVDLLARIASYTARMSRDRESTSSLVDAKYLASMLVKLGAKPRAVEVPQEMVSIASESEASDEAEDTFAEPSRKAQMLFSAEQRWPAVRQWCKVVQVLCLHGRVLSDNDASRLAVLCVRLAIDPQSASMRSTFVWTIQCLLATMPSGSAARSNTFRHLVNLCRPTRHRTQVAVLQTIPHDSQANKLLREWLAWSFVATDSSVADVLVRPSLLGSVLPSVLELLVSPPRESPLRPLALTGKPPFADLDLVEQVKLLTISLTSLADPLVASDLRIEHRKTLERIIRRIETIDSRLRADARKGLQVERLHAKNLLTGLKYSLTYQLMNARGEKSAFGLSEEEEKAIKRKETAHGNEAKRQRLEREDDEAAGRKQSTLDFFRKPAVKRAALARPRQEKAMDVDSEEEVADGLLRT